MTRVLYLLLFLSLRLEAPAQELAEVRESPSTEVYDLLRDHNGHIWVAHNSGLSRYDGRSFVDYGNPLQNGRAVTDLCEDRQGRVWCHNFEGQIYYVAGQRLQLLAGYDFRQERFFPRIGVFGDELVATSVRGFFTCNTRSLRPRYYPMSETTSLTVLPQGVLMLSPGYGFFYYRQGRIRKLKTKLFVREREDHVLQPESSGDTANMLVNPSGLIYRFVLRDDSLLVVDSLKAPGYVNAVTVDGNDWWVHCNAVSFSARGRRVEGRFLTNVLSNVQGHSFWSSLKFGLLAGRRTEAVRVPLPFLDEGDFVKSVLPLPPAGYLLGTQQGKLYWMQQGRVRSRFSINPRNGPIEHIWKLEDDLYLVCANNGVFRLDLRKQRLELIDNNVVVKDAAIVGKRVALATTYGVLNTETTVLRDATNMRFLIPTGSNLRRCRSVCVGPEGALYVALNKGFFRWSDGDSSALSYQGAPLYATRLRNFAGDILVSTFNRGVFVRDAGGVLRPLPLSLARQPNAAPDLRVSGNTAWVLYDDVIQQLGPQLVARELGDLPFRGSEVSALIEEDSGLLVATAQGLFHVPRTPVPMPATHTLIDAVRVNDSLPGPAEGGHFSHRHNNVSLNLSTPWFGGSSHLRYRYRLCTDGGCSWLLSGEGQNSFTFVNLAPGSYTFSAVAVNGIGAPLAPELSYSFVIDPPWWATWWARTLEVLALMSIFFLLGLYLQRRRSRRQRTRYERLLAVEHERQRISAEIHDDLGATLSGVRLLTELAREKMPPGPLQVDLEKIHQSISSLTEKTREVIWTLNTEQDSLESLLLYLQKQAQALFEGAPTRLQVQLPVEVPPVRVSGDVRRQVYLAVREALHNCLKHSGATLCRLSMTYGPEGLRIEVHDDGAGLPAQRSSSAFSSGMRSMQQRMAYTGGQLRIHSNPKQGTRIEFIIPLSQNA
ncbi:sensor histidine kinase [Flaviaesturariibacter terrae]